MKKLTLEELKPLLKIVDNELVSRPYLRYGQSFWNNLMINYPEYSCFTSTSKDCFHISGKVYTLIENICDDEAIEYFNALNLKFKAFSTYNESWSENHGYL